MADNTGMGAIVTVASGGKGSDPKGDLLATARSRLNMAISAYSESREDEIDDLRFYAGPPMCWRLAELSKGRLSMRGHA